jgi:hypothetical protein
MRQASSIWNAGEGIDLITFTRVLRDRQLPDGRRAIFCHEPFHVRPDRANLDEQIPGALSGSAARRFFVEDLEVIFGRRLVR